MGLFFAALKPFAGETLKSGSQCYDLADDLIATKRFDTGNTLLGISSSQKVDIPSTFKCIAVTFERERKNGKAVKTGVFLLLIVVKISHLVNLFATGCRKRKRTVTLNSSRVGSTSVSPQNVREEFVVLFEEYNNPSGHSAEPWASKMTRGL
ncbi:hypothetical protein TNCV_1258611 [Trichonephila clavipes]|nr:hypothetical protein TNCV_1258611 [Trichonephila clavipes]